MSKMETLHKIGEYIRNEKGEWKRIIRDVTTFDVDETQTAKLEAMFQTSKASDVLAKLKIEAENLDIENAHSNADDILSDFVRDLGFAEIANAYDDVPKWFA